MFNPRTLYYLEQLGIRPWVRRANPNSKIKLVVITAEMLSIKEESLLNQILLFMDLKTEQLKRITFSFRLPINADCVISFGASGENITGLQLEPLSELLNNALLKKKLYLQLTRLKKILDCR
jgi:DNA polymerase III psi subunit